MNWPITISLVALAIGAGGLIMSFARTGPEDAAKNLAKWTDALRSLQARVSLEKFLRSRFYRAVSFLVAAIGAIAPLHTAYERIVGWDKASPPAIINHVNTPTVTTPSPTASPTPLPAPLSTPVAPPYQDPTPFSGMSNDDIKKVVTSLTEELRKFEMDFEAQRTAIGAERWTAKNLDERQKEFADREARLAEVRRVEQARFQQEFLGQLRALLEEIGGRLNKTPEGNTQPPGIGEGAMALGNGVLGAHRPLTDLANWFDVYVAKLR